ncbi:MAG TPA: tRNA epoxyqueuosine(34) reductase QueG [Thermoanaerobaculia bacterium]
MDEAQSLAVDRVLVVRVLREAAAEQGFVRIGFARADEPPQFERFRRWIGQGRHARMAYLEETMEVRAQPRSLLAGARSIVCLAARHRTTRPIARDGSRVARYAVGRDYHQTLRERANRFVASAKANLGSFRFRICADSTPRAERSLAAAAGLGWIGKNGCLIDPDEGSFLLLAEVITDLDLPPDEPIAERCGSCVRCLAACPTQAFLAPGLLDAHRCISYWTIEHRGPIPDEMKAQLGDLVFGCDICQEVCPWNASPQTDDGRPATDAEGPNAPDDAIPARADWLRMGKGEWRRRFGATAFNRTGRRGMQRNAAASVGSVRDLAARDLLPVLPSDAGLADAVKWARPRLTPTEADPPRPPSLG